MPKSVLVSVALLLSGPSLAQESLPYEWVEVAEGVFGALQPEGNRFNDSNAVVLVNDEDVVVIDTQNNPSDVRALIGRIREVTDKPVRYVVNTHWHGDHTQGNAVYRTAFPGVEIVGHPTLGQDMPQRAKPALEERMEAYREAIPPAEDRLRKGVSRSGEPLGEEGRRTLSRQIEHAKGLLAAMEEVELTVPTLTVAERMTLVRGERRIVIEHHRGHTRGDLVVFLPREKVLISGDLLDDLPYGGHGYPKEWIEALTALEALDFDAQIPGHGRIRQGKAHLRRVRQMFETIVVAAEEASRAGGSLEELQQRLDLAAYRSELAGDDPVAQRAFDQFVPATIERAWLESRGELPD